MAALGHWDRPESLHSESLHSLLKQGRQTSAFWMRTDPERSGQFPWERKMWSWTAVDGLRTIAYLNSQRLAGLRQWQGAGSNLRNLAASTMDMYTAITYSNQLRPAPVPLTSSLLIWWRSRASFHWVPLYYLLLSLGSFTMDISSTGWESGIAAIHLPHHTLGNDIGAGFVPSRQEDVPATCNIAAAR